MGFNSAFKGLTPRRLCHRPTVFLHQQRRTALSLPQVNIPPAFQKSYKFNVATSLELLSQVSNFEI